MALNDAETLLKIAPKEWKPTIIAGLMIGAMVVAYFVFFAGPITANAEDNKNNKDAIVSQQRLNAQIDRHLSAIDTQLGDLKGAVDQQADNQKLILQFLLTGQRPKAR